MSKKITLKSYLRNVSRQRLIVGALILVCVIGLATTGYFVTQQPAQQAKSITIAPTTKDSTKKITTDTTSNNLEKQPTSSASQETTPPISQPTIKSSTTTKPTTTQNYTPTTDTQPAASTPFRVTSIYLDQPTVYCSGGGDYYIVQIGDVDIYLNSPSGGSVSYGFEVTGGIPDTSNGYHQQGTVPAGASSTSANKLYWGNGSDPHTAFSQTIWGGHGPAAVRAAIYTPNVIYSQWVTIPAQSIGEKCS